MTSQSTTAKQGKARFRFITDIYGELKKVVWLTRQEVIYLTTLVLIITIIVGLILGVLDYGFTRLVNDVFIGG
ncbi:MAG: preprotein translocase subunit SecE [Dehalococcoidales bacterium]|nr:MAG: preprotein translocase subunit SecE [Dehalococcoidales bacterium]